MNTWEQRLAQAQEDIRHEFELKERAFRAKERELEALQEIDRTIIEGTLNLEETFEFIAQLAHTVLPNNPGVQVLTKEGADLLIRASTASDQKGIRVPIANSISGACFTKAALLNVPNVRDPEWQDHYHEIFTGGITSELAVPIKGRGMIIGILNLEHPDEGAFSREHEGVISRFAAQAAIAFERTRLIDETKLFAQLEDLIGVRGQQADPEAILEQAIEQLRHHTPIGLVQILITHGDDLEIVYSTRPQDIGHVVLLKSISGRALTSRRTIILDDVASDEDYKRMLGEDVKSEIAVPIFARAQAIGVLNVESTRYAAFDQYHRYLFERFATQVSIILAFLKLNSDIKFAMEVGHARDSFEALGRSAGNTMHRINNYLGLVKVHLRDIQKFCTGELEDSQFLGRKIDTIAALTQDALDVAKQMRADIAEGREVDINSAIRTAVKEVAEPVENIQVAWNLSDAVTPVRAYAFETVIRDLIHNAMEAMEPKGGGTLKLSSSQVSKDNASGGYVQVRVSDTGTGMSPETQQQIWNIGFSTKKERGGLGYGLWWVRQCILRARGEIYVETEKGSGSTFTIRLPLRLDSSGRP